MGSGLFSLNRLIAESILPEGKTYTFWGKGVSQGHSDAIRRIDGVADAKQYTIPVKKRLNPSVIMKGRIWQPDRNISVNVLSLPKKGQIFRKLKMKSRICQTTSATTIQLFILYLRRNWTKTMEPYRMVDLFFAVDRQEKIIIWLNIPWISIPIRNSASVLTAVARAIARMNAEGWTGAKTIFDIPASYLSDKSAEELRATML